MPCWWSIADARPCGVAAEQDVRAAAGHVGGDRDGAAAARPGPRWALPSRGTWR